MIEHSDIDYSNLFRKLCVESGMKQSLIAEKLRLKRQQEISEYQNCKKHFTNDFLQKISKVFNVPFSEINKTSLFYKNSKSKKETDSTLDDKLKIIQLKRLLVIERIEKVQLQLQLQNALPKIMPRNRNLAAPIYVLI